MWEFQRKKFKYNNTCSVTKLLNECVTFVRNEELLVKYILLSSKKIQVIIPSYLKDIYTFPNNIDIIYSDYPELEFTLFHNEIHKTSPIPQPIIGNNCLIHPTVIMDVAGLKVINYPDGRKLQIKHTGNVIIGDDVEIGPYSVIHRGTLDSTVIDSGVKAGAYTNIGHNSYIGKNTVCAVRVTINGSVEIGNQCWLGSNVTIRNNIKITDKVIIGTGAVVVKDITESGIYVGNPAKKIKPYKEGWNF